MENSELRKKLHIGVRKNKGCKLPKKCKPLIIIGSVITGIFIINFCCGSLIKGDVNINPAHIETNEISFNLDENSDPDTDGISTKDELTLKTNPFSRDTDGDHITDDGDSDPLNPTGDITKYHEIKLKPFMYKDLTIKHETIESFIKTEINSIKGRDYTYFSLKNFNGTVSTDKDMFIKDKFGNYTKVKEVNDDSEILVFDKTPEILFTAGIGNKNSIIKSSLLGNILNLILPRNGLFHAGKSYVSFASYDIDNSLGDATYTENILKELTESRFSQLCNSPEYITYLDNRLNNGEIVPISIIKDSSEFIGFITGKFTNGTYNLTDKDGKYLCSLKMFINAKQLSDTENLTLMESLEFEAGDLNSSNARLVFLN